MKDHFNHTISKEDFILHATKSSNTVFFNAGKVIDIDENKQILICKMCNRTKLSYISNMYCTIVMGKHDLAKKYPGVYEL